MRARTRIDRKASSSSVALAGMVKLGPVGPVRPTLVKDHIFFRNFVLLTSEKKRIFVFTSAKKKKILFYFVSVHHRCCLSGCC